MTVFIRRTDEKAATAGNNTLELDVFENEIIASVSILNRTNSCRTWAYFYQGKNADQGISIIAPKLKGINEGQLVLYPFGDTRGPSGTVHAGLEGCKASDDIVLRIGVESRG